MLLMYILLALFVLAADQLSKLFIILHTALGETLASPGLFDITYVQNTGAAFSMMSGKIPVLSIISLVFCAGVIVYWIKKRPSHPLLCTALSLMFSGAMGNALDRIFRGYVVDFIQTAFINFPIFNIADIAITAGAAMLIIYVMVFNKD